jgi:CheY-like chemotaxis protein/anti-sigma regulatory factor (Ser/Thr protein kinase)
VAGALHDVSNSLTVILGWAAEARAGASSPEALLHSLCVIEEQARIARQLARRVLGADGANDDDETQLEALLGPAIDALAVEAQRAGVRLSLLGRAGGVRVQRGTDLRQILTNLVLNAMAHAPKGSEVRLELTVSPTRVTLDVQDEGPGVPEPRRASVFEGDSTRDGGAGIGLRHARALARAAAGDLDLALSERGALFRVTWPRWGSLSIPPPSAGNPQVLLGSRVLVVEDDEHVALLLESSLGARGATVRVARDAKEFEVAIGAGQQDIALIDLSPLASDLSGALSRLRAQSPEVALVFISGSAVGLPDEAELDDVQWVRKPFEIAEVVDAVLATRKVPGSSR